MGITIHEQIENQSFKQMDLQTKRHGNKYDRVMSRVNNRSRNTLKSTSLVTRHERPSTVSVGAKPSVSNVSSSLFSELPLVLNDYSPKVPSRQKFLVKPRRTIPSLNPSTSPHRHLSVTKNITQTVPKIKVKGSAPVISNSDSENWADTHLRQCYSSRSHCRLKELKDEIKAYRDTEKQMKLRARLYKSCGVILNEEGHVAADKAVQVQELDTKESVLYCVVNIWLNTNIKKDDEYAEY
ncbi:unnamed protein product [Diatraea saccharalis]|uniref:Uncharacterized protein n=1 Tax=Diatraea saccharalis TaxID=40085 RepID=A0A9N9R366_9NEOP|nr:unnamed protein product [Diatraea saccharalis]